jgi:SAM-dependent methyltransferase
VVVEDSGLAAISPAQVMRELYPRLVRPAVQSALNLLRRHGRRSSMGLAENNLRLLLEAKARHGVSLTRSATLGRQELFLSEKALQGILQSFGYRLSETECADLAQGGFADSLLRFLGAEEVRSFDVSDYEGATDVHDFNARIDSELHGQFDLVLDSGTLQHIFFATTALENCMKMVRVGGHLIVMSPANNRLGHGFYQFSPEFYFRSLTQENGFEIRRASVFEGHADPVWYDVVDPATIGGGSEAATRRPTTVAVVARKAAELPLFARPPQQSLYAEAWKTPGPLVQRRRRPLVQAARGYIPESSRSFYRWARSLLSRRRYASAMFSRRRVPPDG